MARVCYQMIERFDSYLVIPLAFAALGLRSGALPGHPVRLDQVLVGAGQVRAIAVIAYSAFGISVWVAQSIDVTAASSTESPVAGPPA